MNVDVATLVVAVITLAVVIGAIALRNYPRRKADVVARYERRLDLDDDPQDRPMSSWWAIFVNIGEKNATDFFIHAVDFGGVYVNQVPADVLLPNRPLEVRLLGQYTVQDEITYSYTMSNWRGKNKTVTGCLPLEYRIPDAAIQNAGRKVSSR